MLRPLTSESMLQPQEPGWDDTNWTLLEKVL